eukprot:SAG31_NODE_12861_length_911_cov_0.958128_1_plen_117_part_00
MQVAALSLSTLAMAAALDAATATGDGGTAGAAPTSRSVLLQTSQIVVNADGSYSVPVDGKPWLQSVAPRLRIGSEWSELSLKTSGGAVTSSGSDSLGDFKRVDFSWTARSASATAR